MSCHAETYTQLQNVNERDNEAQNKLALTKGMCSESYYLFTFWEISDIILETVQDRCIAAKKH